MEIFEPVRELTNKINVMKPSLHIDKIIIHIERAFQLFTLGNETGDEQNYTDVIYRCNQAFEGCSRQAFLVLAEKSEEELKKVQAWKIEKYLIENKILNERVFPLFQNYREKWRNESSHNFKLFFKEEEAYIAILSICSYAYVLLNQIVLKISLSDIKGLEPISLATSKKGALVEEIEKATNLFLKEVNLEKYKTGSTVKRITEVQFNGIYASFLQNKIADVNVMVEGKVNSESRLRYDLLLVRGKEKVVIELKSVRQKGQESEVINNYLIEYLNHLKGAKGILFYFKGIGKMTELEVKNFKVQKDSKQYWIKVFTGK